jgi:putative transposase
LSPACERRVIGPKDDESRASGDSTCAGDVSHIVSTSILEESNEMPHTYTLQLIHCVFSTKGRSALIADPPRLWTYMRAIGRNCGVNIAAIGGTNNHVHLLMTIPATSRTADIVRTLKANSSRWMNEIGHKFAWQDGYAAISVSPSQIPAVARYIDNQTEHHRTRSFEHEYVALLEKSGGAFDVDQVF